MLQRLVFTVFILVLQQLVVAQDSLARYSHLTDQADGYYLQSNWQQAANIYQEAFRSYGGMGKIGHRYRCAISYVRLNQADSALRELEIIAEKGRFTGYQRVSSDTNFNLLHKDIRWGKVLDRIRENGSRAKTDANQN